MDRLAGLDVGNDSIKLVFDDNSEPLLIPNITAPGHDRFILQEEDSPLKALDVVIHSPALQRNNQRYFVGLLAMEHEDKIELEDSDNKAVSDQSLIVSLTALAYAGLKRQAAYENDEPFQNSGEFEYIIGTGLPVRNYASCQQIFMERLVGEHEVTFLSTPQWKNRKVKVIIRKTVVSIEGAAAIYNLATDTHLQPKDDELYHGVIGVCEIGALTTDLPVIKRMAVDNHFSYGEQIGLSHYLDHIIRDVEDSFGYTFPSRAKLAQRIKSKQYTVQRIGEGQADIKPIVDNYFSRAALRIVELIKKRWNKYPDIQCFYVVGGGAVALKSYLLEAAGGIKLRFVEQSELQNVYGYLKMAKLQLETRAMQQADEF